MKHLFYTIFNLLVLTACNTGRNVVPIPKTTETDSIRDERHMKEGIMDITQQLNLPMLQPQNNKFELRIWISNFLRGDSIFLLTVENDKVRSAEIHYQRHFIGSISRKKDTSNLYLRERVDSSKMRILLLSASTKPFIDTLLNTYILHFPQKKDFIGIQEVGTDGSGMLFEIQQNNSYINLSKKTGRNLLRLQSICALG